MEVIFEVNKYDFQTIEEIKSSDCLINEIYSTNGLNGTEIVAVVIALIPAVKDIVLKLWSKDTVSIKISNEFGSTELTARNQKELSELIDKYLEFEKKISSNRIDSIKNEE